MCQKSCHCYFASRLPTPAYIFRQAVSWVLVFVNLQLITCATQGDTTQSATAPYDASRRMMLQRAQSQLAAPAQGRTPMCAPRMHKLSKRSLVVTAAAQPEEPSSSTSPPPSLQAQLQTFANKYETNALSSGVGALAVTGWCVAHGQDPATAAGISVMSVVVALVSGGCGSGYASFAQCAALDRASAVGCSLLAVTLVIHAATCWLHLHVLFACFACQVGSTQVLLGLCNCSSHLTTLGGAFCCRS